MDRRDSLGVCVDSQRGVESLQRDQAVCISTNGELTPSEDALTVTHPDSFSLVRLDMFSVRKTELNWFG